MEPQHNQGWEEWVGQYLSRLLLFARQQVADLAEAEDLVQDAIVESWRRKGDGMPPPLPLVYATIRRRAIDQGRSSRRRQQREELVGQARPLWFESDMGAGDESARIQDALQHLSPEQREVVVMKLWSELTFQEIADALEIPLFTAASRYRYAIAELKKTLGTDT